MELKFNVENNKYFNVKEILFFLPGSGWKLDMGSGVHYTIIGY